MKLLPASLHVFQLGACVPPAPCGYYCPRSGAGPPILANPAESLWYNCIARPKFSFLTQVPTNVKPLRRKNKLQMDDLHYTKNKTIRLTSFITTYVTPQPCGVVLKIRRLLILPHTPALTPAQVPVWVSSGFALLKNTLVSCFVHSLTPAPGD